ncbi:hypothetical protein [Neobacillus niacini]|uniref:HNH endonuclease n=1 Tax=Neobacillus niacini TaxID=86668 RepID=UPI00286C5B2B|nr:hypothetical protein [Neobacillus niacini]
MAATVLQKKSLIGTAKQYSKRALVLTARKLERLVYSLLSTNQLSVSLVLADCTTGHHVRKLSELKSNTPWNTVMIANNRKTLATCEHCYSHIQIV